MSTHRVVRFHDGERFASGLDLGAGRKYQHLLTITDGGVKVIHLDARTRLQDLGPITKRQIAAFRRAGRNLGITRSAQKVLASAKAERRA